MRLGEWLRRWRSSRGYGVHSPLAYRLVRHVVRPPRDVAYYGEERLRLADCDALTVGRARFLLRFVAELQPAFVWTAPGLPEIYKEAVREAGCVIRIFDGEIFPAEIRQADMVVIDGGRLRKKDLKSFFAPGKSLIGFSLKASFIQTVKNAMGGGVCLDGAGSLLCVSTHDICRHEYLVRKF